MSREPTYSEERDFAEAIKGDVEALAGPALKWVRETFDPDEVFDENELEAWARENKYIPEDEMDD